MSRKTLICILCIFYSIVFSNTVLSTPVNPQVKDIAGHFSVDIQTQFSLFADSRDRRLVWYIPKSATIKNNGGRPALNVTSDIITSGPFKDLTSINFAGTFTTMSSISGYTRLKFEASAKGFYVRPAIATSANTQVLLSGFMLDNNGDLNVECSEVTWDTPSGPVVIPVCKAQDSHGQWHEIDFVSQFNSTLAQHGSVIQSLPFSGTTLPGWEFYISSLLQTGSNWDGILQMAIDWELPTHTTVTDAKYAVNWRTLTNYIRSQIRAYRWRLTLPQVLNILKNAVRYRKGIYTSYNNNGQWSSVPASDFQKYWIENRIIHKLRRHLFVAITPRHLTYKEKMKIFDVPRDIYLPTQVEFNSKWGHEATRDFRSIEDRYTEMDARMKLICPEPRVGGKVLPECNYEPTPRPIITPPIFNGAYYILKSNYFWLMQNVTSHFTLSHTDIEHVSATTLLGIDCIMGDIDMPLIYLNDPACN